MAKRTMDIKVEVESAGYLRVWCNPEVVPLIKVIEGVANTEESSSGYLAVFIDERYRINEIADEIRSLKVPPKPKLKLAPDPGVALQAVSSIPEKYIQKSIRSMDIGETAWTPYWAIYRVKNSCCWINALHPALKDRKGRAYYVLVRRTTSGVAVTLPPAFCGTWSEEEHDRPDWGYSLPVTFE